MAATTATFNKGSTRPTLTAMAVNDTKTITGKKMTSAFMRQLRDNNPGKKFSFRRTGIGRYVVTRLK